MVAMSVFDKQINLTKLPRYTHTLFVKEQTDHLSCSGVRVHLAKIHHSFVDSFYSVTLPARPFKAHVHTDLTKLCESRIVISSEHEQLSQLIINIVYVPDTVAFCIEMFL